MGSIIVISQIIQVKLIFFEFLKSSESAKFERNFGSSPKTMEMIFLQNGIR